ncbi:hypothetical protein ABZW11_08395 [Nonomuraea sp. NPDC004580]|uniref:hypothetical protein n=1 Tax=Nonomuraea sp. NPDC004580 TaxID=3154552 RepID=UPI0033A99797
MHARATRAREGRSPDIAGMALRRRRQLAVAAKVTGVPFAEDFLRRPMLAGPIRMG